MRRRKFVNHALLSSLYASFGIKIAFADKIPSGYVPMVLQEDPYEMFDKHSEMRILNERPWNMEAQAHLLNEQITPTGKIFIRNNGIIPEKTDFQDWKLTVDGESVKRTGSYSLKDLISNFRSYTYQLTLECAGNGRNEFYPPARGNQWTVGAVGCAQWTGVRLSDLLKDVGIKDDAVYVAYYGLDKHLSGDPNKEPISRGVPLKKALMEETLLAYELNGEAIPLIHGHPLRLVCGGWPASASGKWLKKIAVRNKVHDGTKMGGKSYRIPCDPVPPGASVADEDMCIIESMPVKSLITYPRSGAIINSGESLKINGHAWAGELEVIAMEYSIDFGSSWKACTLEPPVNRLAWQHWEAEINFPMKGYFEVWARATDTLGNKQSLLVPGWNPKGYLNNACHRIAVKVV